MADKKITELTELTTPQSNDELPIVDNSGVPITKRVKYSNLITGTNYITKSEAIAYSVAL
jgi:hypothetical protein